ncbi:MAG: hypothetical protein WKF97_00820 [Chitinophagaceae bacterium]
MEADKAGFFKATQQLAEEYVKERLLLLKLQTAEKTARLFAVVFAAFIFGFLSFFVLLFLSLMAVFYIAGLTGSIYYGLGIMTAFYSLLLFLCIYFRRQWLYKFFSDLVVRLFFENTEITNGKQKS